MSTFKINPIQRAWWRIECLVNTLRWYTGNFCEHQLQRSEIVCFVCRMLGIGSYVAHWGVTPYTYARACTWYGSHNIEYLDRNPDGHTDFIVFQLFEDPGED